MKKLGFAVIGCGEWGKNHVRVLASMPSLRLLHVADLREDRRALARTLAPDAAVSDSLDAALADPRVDAVVVSSPSRTHAALGRTALAAGKHVFLEKPLAPSVEEAEDLVARAARAKKMLMVGHVLLHHPAVKHLKRMVDRKGLGDIHYLYAQRVNLGRIRTDEGALFSLAPHDVSVMAYLLGEGPESVAAHGAAYVQPTREDVVFLTLRFPHGVLGHVHLSWLDPHKTRRLTLVGSRRMAVFDDMEPAEKIRIHDKGPGPIEPGTYPEALALRFGETRIPRLSPGEPLREEMRAFARSIVTGIPAINDGRSGVAVVKVLAAAERSLAAHGREISV